MARVCDEGSGAIQQAEVHCPGIDAT
jgi:hypothetical protein